MKEARAGEERPIPSTFRVASLVVRFAVRRWTNRIRSFSRKRAGDAKRSATGRKRAGGGILLVVLSFFVFLNGFNLSSQIVRRLALDAQERSIGDVVLVSHSTMGWVHRSAVEKAQERHARGEHRDAWRAPLRRAFQYEVSRSATNLAERPASVEDLMDTFDERGEDGFREARDGGFAGDTARAAMAPLALIAALFAVAVALFGVGGPNQDLSKVEWTLEWWFTFPVPVRGLLLARLFETAVVSPLAWFFLFPFLSVVFWSSGYEWAGIGVGLGATLYYTLLAGAFRVVAETGLRRFLSLGNVARVHGALSILSSVAFLAALGAVSPDWLDTLCRAARRLPDWMLLNPLSLPIGMVLRGPGAVWCALGCAVVCLLGIAAAVALAGRMVRDGLVVSGGPHQGSRRRAALARRADAGPRTIALSPVARKELHLLFRDRIMFGQVFVAPGLLFGFQLLMNPRLLNGLAANPRTAGAMTFAVSAFVLMTGACNTLVMDAPTLWIYFTVPRPLERVLADKALFWSGLAGAIGLVAFLALTRAHPTAIAAGFPMLCLSLAGVVLYAFVATAIGALATDPLETEPRRRIQVSMIYLFMTLAGMFGYALYTPSLWAKFAQMVLSALLVFALWQKVRDRAPYLLDPMEAPPPTIAVADGVIAVLAFFVLQGVIALCLGLFGTSPGASLLIAFVASGSIVGCVTLFTLWRSGIPDLLRTMGITGSWRAAGWVAAGIAGGFSGGLLAHGYLWAIGRVDFLRHLRDEALELSSSDASMLPWFAALAVGAAPIFEEFLFRGVLYGGFRRSLGRPSAAVFSAAVFAIVHPAIAAAPVFVLGLIAAFVYERSRSLLAPVAAHMTYNAVVVGSAWLALHRATG